MYAFLVWIVSVCISSLNASSWELYTPVRILPCSRACFISYGMTGVVLSVEAKVR